MLPKLMNCCEIMGAHLCDLMGQATELEFYFYQLHRDTRLQEIVGDAVIYREQDPDGGGEIIRQQNKPGGILTASALLYGPVYAPCIFNGTKPPLHGQHHRCVCVCVWYNEHIMGRHHRCVCVCVV